jgi:pimeloyl-ACP methyl ester carboxylesterase
MLLRRLFAPILAALLIGASSPAAFDAGPYVRAPQLVDVGGGRHISLYCSGTGSPTVILESGLGRGTQDWHLVQPVIAKSTRVCSYARAGMEFSDPAVGSQTAVKIVHDLHAALTAAKIAPPYVLVGHSIGGLYVRLYADRYLGDVRGFVFLESSAEHQLPRYKGTSPAMDVGYAEQQRRFRTCESLTRRGPLRPGTSGYDLCVGPPNPDFPAALNAVNVIFAQHPSYYADAASEWDNFDDSGNTVAREQRAYGALPIIVLTADTVKHFGGPGVPLAMNQKLWNLWYGQHDAIAHLSSVGAHYVVTNAGHYIQLDQPSAVVSAIAEVLSQARAADTRR